MATTAGNWKNSVAEKRHGMEETQMVHYGLTDKVAIITGANNPWGDRKSTRLNSSHA